jgi:hypothetical protein
MSKLSDGIPEPLVINERSKRTTTEFCNEQQEGYRCMLLKGHAGMHECLAYEGIARWASSPAGQ